MSPIAAMAERTSSVALHDARVPTRPVRVLELRSVRGLGGGPEKTILTGAAVTDPARISIVVCYIRDERDRCFDIDRRASELGVDYQEITERHSLDPAVWAKLRALVRARQIDIVHSHDYKTDLLAYLLGKYEGVIPLATAHGWSGHSRREQWLYYPLDKKILAGFPRVIAVSDGLRRTLIAAGVPVERIDVVLNGIDHVSFRRDPARVAAARARFGVLEGDITIGGVGRLEWLKRFDLLVDVCARLQQEFPHVRLLLAGEGSARAELEAQIARLGLQQTCRIVGHVGDIVDFHHALDVFVQSSATEGAPNVVLEAMALETPIVATDVGGTTELIRPGIDGLAVPAQDADAMAVAIRSVIADPETARRRACAARERVQTLLSFSGRVERINCIYERLFAERALRQAERSRQL
jgi:glycosyltransferase involved in cell wall biosynthesis